jgi:hypothetical protein
MKCSIRQAFHRAWIGLMFVRSKKNGPARLDDSAEQFGDLFLGRFRVRPSKLFFEILPFKPLSGPHRATAPKFHIVESVDEMRCSDQEIDIHRPVLAVLEGAKTV